MLMLMTWAWLDAPYPNCIDGIWGKAFPLKKWQTCCSQNKGEVPGKQITVGDYTLFWGWVSGLPTSCPFCASSVIQCRDGQGTSRPRHSVQARSRLAQEEQRGRPFVCPVLQVVVFKAEDCILPVSASKLLTRYNTGNHLYGEGNTVFFFYFIKRYFKNVLAMLHGMRDLNSLTRNPPHACCSGSMES